MHLGRPPFASFVMFALLTAASSANAEAENAREHAHEHEQNHRQHDAHVHGVGDLSLALEGREVHVELDSPAANIVGFEHPPVSEADLARLNETVATLKEGNRLLKFNDDAGCRMENVSVSSALTGGEHDGGDHSNIVATYHFECAEPDKITQLSVEVFAAFPNTERLRVQFIIDSKQGAVDVTATDHVVQF